MVGYCKWKISTRFCLRITIDKDDESVYGSAFAVALLRLIP